MQDTRRVDYKPLLVGIAVASVALSARGLLRFGNFLKANPRYFETSPSRKFPGGFQAQMDKREAALILGLR